MAESWRRSERGKWKTQLTSARGGRGAGAGTTWTKMAKPNARSAEKAMPGD